MEAGTGNHRLPVSWQQVSHGRLEDRGACAASVALAAGAAKVLAIDTVFSDLNDQEGLTAECQVARQLGFKGKFALHPKQIDIINREFSPSAAEFAYAERVVEAFNRAQEGNAGVITVDGKMVDFPVVERARQLLRLKREN